MKNMDNNKLKIEVKTKSKDRVKLSFDCTMGNYDNLKKLSEKTGHNRNELINILLKFAIECVEIV